MIRLLAVWNVILTVIVVVLLSFRFDLNTEVRAAENVQVVRANRLEILDQSGKTRAVLGVDAPNANPKLSLYDNNGREATFLTLNSQGYATMYFQSKQTEAKVSLGYLWGSDSPTASELEDPLGSWGVRVRGVNGTQTSFGMLNNGQSIRGSGVTIGHP